MDWPVRLCCLDSRDAGRAALRWPGRFVTELWRMNRHRGSEVVDRGHVDEPVLKSLQEHHQLGNRGCEAKSASRDAGG
jgi:hypothetical protein